MKEPKIKKKPRTGSPDADDAKEPAEKAEKTGKSASRPGRKRSPADTAPVPVRPVPLRSARDAEQKGEEKISLKSILHGLSGRLRSQTETVRNQEYAKIAEKFRYARFGVLIVLVLFVLLMFTLCRDEMTVENMRYFLRDFDTGSIKYTGQYSTLRYERAAGADFALFKGDFVTVKGGETRICSTAGGIILQETNPFVSPRVLTSDKYFLVYDPGESSHGYALYNAFSLLHEGTCKEPIRGASLSDSGTYCIVTSSGGYKGVVEIYNRDFKLLNTIYRDRFIWDAVLSEDGKRLLLVSSFEEGGDWCSEIEVIDPYDDSPLFRSVQEGCLAMKGAFLTGEADSFRVLTDRGLVYFENGSAQGREHSFSGRIPVTYCMDSRYTAVVFDKNVLGTDFTVLITDETEGKSVSYTVSADIRSLLFASGRLFALTDDSLLILPCDGGEVKAVHQTSVPRKLLPIDENYLLLCFDSFAEVITADGSFKNPQTN